MSPQAQRVLLRRRSLVAAVAALGICLSLASFDVTRQDRDRHLQNDFARRAENHSALVREIILNFKSALFGLRNLFIGSHQVTAAEFATAAHEILQRYHGITALEWVPIVPHADRAALEARISAANGQPFQFVTGEGRRSPDAAEYFRILYVEPMAGNERAYGYDLRHGPTTAGLERSRQSSDLTVSHRIRLIQEQDPNQYSVILIWPVRKGPPGGEGTTGYVQAVIRIADMLACPLRDRSVEPLDILYLDRHAPDPASRLLYHDPADEATPPADEASFRASQHLEVDVPIGDRHWTILYRSNPAWLAESDSLTPWWLLAGGFIITGLLAGVVQILGRRAEVIGAEVERQTVELKESRRQLETLMQNLPGMAYRFGYEHGRKVLFLSNGSEPLTGYTVAELSSGQPHPREIIHPEDLPFVRQKTREAVHDRRSFEMEYRIRTKNGPEKWVLSRGQGVYAEDGRLRFIEGLVIDISMRKLVEAQNLHIERRMQETQKRESLGLLAGGVAHDFNNLLTTILGNATMARLDGSGDRGAADNLAQIEQAARHAATLCKQMLAYAGQGQLTKENVDLNQVIREMLPLVQASVGNSVTLDFQAGENLPGIHADPAEISQVVMNLVINAGEAMNGGEGTVAITTAVRLIEPARLQLCVPSSELPSSRCLVLTIADTGSGMPADVIKRIFDPFFSTKFEGRGLGLAAVIGIVRGHHAALQVESEPGRGTCFTVMFPLPETAEAERPPVALIVDDDEPVREVTGELMRSLGYVAETAASGEEAIARVQAYSARYAVVLLDCVMPRVSGEHALTVLQGIRADLPVILMSGNNERGSQNGAVPFLTKPFSRAILEETLRRIRPDDSSV